MENYTGKRLDGRYEIHEVIGVGGMAVVYKAYDNIDGKTVSVKILKEEYLANEEFRRRFKNESKAIAVLSHPNIVKVYDVSYGDRLQYIVMEYVEGITLKEYIEQQGRLEVREAVHFSMQILRALQHAHDKGVVHRDIKPQNILLLSNGDIKVTDFGIARFSCSETKTITDSAIGSVHYISPEQARGDITDDKTDIYSAGVVLYEMLTGKVPFEADSTVSVALMQVQNEPKRPREINPSIPVGLEQIILRAMQKNTRDRYQSAAEMLLDIEEFRRNPNIRFRENFVNDNPTKYIPSTAPVSSVVNAQRSSAEQAAPVRQAAAAEPKKQKSAEELTAEKKKSLLTGIGVGLGVLAAAILAFLWFFTPVLNGSKSTVPNLLNLNYEEDILGNPKYKDFRIEPEYVPNSTREDGIVFLQNPNPGQKIDIKKETIKISVAKTIKMVLIPDVTGNSYNDAKSILEGKGFTVTATPQTSSEYDFGTVINTYPAPETEYEEGSNVIIYYASDEKMITVPKLIGWDVETAKSILESVNLQLDPSIEYKDSSSPYGEIIAQSVDTDKKVDVGTKIKVTVSTGVPETTAPEASYAYISVQLPDYSASTGTIRATLNGDELFEREITLDGTPYNFSVTGTGEINTLKVFVNSNLVYTCRIDFTSRPGIVTDVSSGGSGNSGVKSIMPSVTGMSTARARITLNALGFTNIEVVTTPVSNPNKTDVVISQSPEASNSALFPTTYDLSTPVVLTVGVYSDGEENEQ